MKRPRVATSLVALGTLLGTALAAVTPASSASAGGDTTAPEAVVVGVDAKHDRALLNAEKVLNGEAASGTDGPHERVDATLALRDLFVARPGLAGDDSVRAANLLARPTDGPGDEYGDGYTVGSVKKCSEHVCVHYVRSTADAPPSPAWADTTLKTMEKVWRLEVNELGYRRPAKDGTQGGEGGKFDVYLKELGGQGIFGYCAPERFAGSSSHNVASGYCVLDNDFARSQFGRAPIESLRVTAAHEFFHAIQFAYDFREDPWLLESTATWMEERFADSVNDSRNYLRFGQLGNPSSSLDFFNPSGLNQYGNWAFWEFLSQRHGNGIVRRVWERAGDFRGAPDQYSTSALRTVLSSRGGLTNVFGAYAAGNTIPGRTYQEGSSWPVAPTVSGATLTAGKRKATFGPRINHLASKNVALRPGESIEGRRWQVRIKVDGPSRVTDPAAYVIVKLRNGNRVRKQIRLNQDGQGVSTLAFDRSSVRSAVVSLANVSTRYRCREGTTFSCAGIPRDQNAQFRLTAQVFQR